MTIKPQKEFIHAKLIKEKSLKPNSLIYVPEEYRKETSFLRVIAVGPDVSRYVTPGSVLLFDAKGSDTHRINDDEVLIAQSDIIGVLQDA